MKHVFFQNQKERDMELSKLCKVSYGKITKKPIAGKKCITIYKGKKLPKSESDMLSLYASYQHLDVVGYYRTLMYTSVYRRNKNLMKLIKATHGKTCLDFGSGVGTHAIALLENSNDVSILDVPGPLFDFAQKRIEHRGLSCTAYVNTDFIESDIFDVIICTDVIEHVFDPLQEIQKIARIIKKKGILHMEVSENKKKSSGHFVSTYNKWIKEAKPFLYENFKELKPTIFEKL